MHFVGNILIYVYQLHGRFAILGAHRFSGIHGGCTNDSLLDFYTMCDGMFVLIFQGNILLTYLKGDYLVRWMQK